VTVAALRSWLYVPGDDTRKIAKAAASEADVVILDLEDGCPGDRKAAGRDCVREALGGVDFGRSLRYVRINSCDTPYWRDDLEATLDVAPDGLVLPKASARAAVLTVSEVIRARAPAPGSRLPELAAIVTEDV
jgi:citrate lyase subunit beta/citryl-CoA lyase